MALTVSRTADIAAASDAVQAVLRNLSTYPDWMPIVSSAKTDGDDHWLVELRVAIGPFARSKRIRMRRSVDSPQLIVFTRSEADGRDHATWELRLELVKSEIGTNVNAMLRYEGKMWTPGPVEDALESGLDNGIVKLQEFVTRTM
jgi:carbon monoxide dehydrogenase subunit G